MVRVRSPHSSDELEGERFARRASLRGCSQRILRQMKVRIQDFVKGNMSCTFSAGKVLCLFNRRVYGPNTRIADGMFYNTFYSRLMAVAINVLGV